MTLQELEDALVELSPKDRRAVVERADRRYMSAIYRVHDEAMRPGLIRDYEARVQFYGEELFCRDFEDALDGFTLHARACPLWPKSFWGVGSQCVPPPPGKSKRGNQIPLD